MVYKEEDLIDAVIIYNDNDYFVHKGIDFYITIKSDGKIYFIHENGIEQEAEKYWTIEKVLYKLNNKSWIISKNRGWKTNSSECTCLSWDLFNKGCQCGGS